MRPLTIAQRRVVELYDQGLSTKQIARKLGISPNAVKQRRKLGLRNLGRYTPLRPVVPPGVLTPRQKEVYDLYCAGLTYPQIGARLFISADTAQNITRRARKKLGVPYRNRDRLDATAIKVLELLAAGATPPEIVKMTGMSESGPRSATRRARTFFAVETTQEAVEAALAAGMISLPEPLERLLLMLKSIDFEPTPWQRERMAQMMGAAGWLFPQRVIDARPMEVDEWHLADGASTELLVDIPGTAQEAPAGPATAR